MNAKIEKMLKSLSPELQKDLKQSYVFLEKAEKRRRNKFQCTDEQKNLLRTALKKYEPIHVEKFIVDLQEVCHHMMWRLSRGDRTQHKMEVEGMLKNFKHTISDLKRLVYPKKPTYVYYDDLTPDKLAHINGTHTNAIEALHALQAIVRRLEAALSAEKRTQGRPPAESFHFARTIANIFSIHIENPTTYDDGPFAEVVRIAFEIIGLPSRDPSRPIRAAAKRKNPSSPS